MTAATPLHDRRLLVTAVRAGDGRRHGGFVDDRLGLPLLLRPVCRDTDRSDARARAGARVDAGVAGFLPDQVVSDADRRASPVITA